MEGMPRPASKESPRQDTIEEGKQEKSFVSEGWISRKELAPSREYIGFEIRAARIMADKMNKPLVEVAREYTTLLHSHLWPDTDSYIDTDGLSDEELSDALYESEKRYYDSKPPVEYHEDDRYGCFTWHHQIDVPVVDIHFSNMESDASTGPLAKEKVAQRLQELRDMFTAVRKECPDTEEVEGNSWLYGIEAYRRLFPESYTAQMEENTDENIVGRGSSWGQFTDSSHGLNQDLAEQFLANLEALEQITPEGVRQSFPLKTYRVRGPIQDFYSKYEVA